MARARRRALIPLSCSAESALVTGVTMSAGVRGQGVAHRDRRRGNGPSAADAPGHERHASPERRLDHDVPTVIANFADEQVPVPTKQLARTTRNRAHPGICIPVGG